MFLTACKTAVTESLRSVYGSNEYFKSIDIEYPEDSVRWPALLVNYRVDGPVTWTGINPDEFQVNEDFESNYDWDAIRLGRFDGTIDLTILSLSSQERDRLWDALVELVLMGRLRQDTESFHNLLNSHDLVALTLLESEVTPAGDSIGPGVPWDNQALAYEATLRLKTTGQFFADTYNRELISIEEITIHPYREDQEVFGENDGLGEWK